MILTEKKFDSRPTAFINKECFFQVKVTCYLILLPEKWIIGIEVR